jgi:hypothetical protein
MPTISRVRGDGMTREPGKVCTRFTQPFEIIGSACPLCGHTNLVHPMTSRNRTLDGECLLCRLEERIRYLESFPVPSLLHGTERPSEGTEEPELPHD